jgi:hypothetical protein
VFWVYPMTTIEVILVGDDRRMKSYRHRFRTLNWCNRRSQSRSTRVHENPARRNFQTRMAKKKALKEKKEPLEPVKNVAKDIDDIFATKKVTPLTSEKPLKGILKAPKTTTVVPEIEEVEDLASVRSKVRAAKAGREIGSLNGLKDDDFADIRGTKKRSLSRFFADWKGNERWTASQCTTKMNLSSGKVETRTCALSIVNAVLNSSRKNTNVQASNLRWNAVGNVALSAWQ